MALALKQLSDPATPMWLLCLLQEQGPQAQHVVDHCQDALEALARGPLLTVRALARQLLTNAASVPMGASDPAGPNPPSRLYGALLASGSAPPIAAEEQGRLPAQSPGLRRALPYG